MKKVFTNKSFLFFCAMIMSINSSCQNKSVTEVENLSTSITMNSMDQRSDFEPDTLNLINANLTYTIPKYDTALNFYTVCLIGELGNGLSDTTLRKFPNGEINFITYYNNSKEIFGKESYAKIAIKCINKKNNKDTVLATTKSIPLLYGKAY